jgi:hypothetical protein
MTYRKKAVIDRVRYEKITQKCKWRRMKVYCAGCPLLVIMVWGILRSSLPLAKFQEKQFNTTDEVLWTALYCIPSKYKGF